jgi:hypothetical protein
LQKIDDVLDRLDGMIDRCERERLRAGYFAALYRHMTLQVKLGIAAGLFQDGARMEHLDILFASRYFDAFDAHMAGRRPTLAWTAAFEGNENKRLTILQQLLLGINAHINLDLGLASAQTCPGAALPGLRQDFNEINEIIATLVDVVQDEIAEVSPWIGLLDRVAGRTDEKVVNFSIDVARAEAWRLAEQVAPLAPSQQAPVVTVRDEEVAWLAGLIRKPGMLLGLATRLIAAREVQDERAVIRILSDRLQPEAVMTRWMRRKAAATAGA